MYSGLGIYYLQKVIEESTKKPLEALARELVFEVSEIGMKYTTFYPDYTLASMADEKECKPGVIYLEDTEEGLVYETRDMKDKGILPWARLPHNLPRSIPDTIEAKDQWLSILLD